MTDRFEVMTCAEAERAGLREEGWDLDLHYCIVENLPGGGQRYVGDDQVAPEDTLLVRDFSWVVAELNKLAEESRFQMEVLDAELPKV